MKVIEIPLSVAGCNKALKELEKYRKEIKPKLDMVCKRLAQIGADAASYHGNEGDLVFDISAFGLCHAADAV